MKLMLDRTKEKGSKPRIKPNLYESPIRWWKVTTAKDEGAMATRDLGIHYGHIAEIALSLPIPCMFSYNFSPSDKYLHTPERETRKLVRKSANISLDITSKTWDLSEEELIAWFEKFLDTDEIIVKPCNYYASVTISLVE